MPPHNPKKPFGETLKPDNDTQSRIVSLFAEFSSAEPPLSAEQLLNGIRESLSAAQFVNSDVVKKPTIYQKIKAFLERYNIEVPTTSDSGNLIARRLVCRIWDSPDYAKDRSEALAAFDRIRNGITPAAANSPIGSASIMQDVFCSPRNDKASSAGARSDKSPQYASRNLASLIAKRCQNESSKCNGESYESWDKYLDTYIRAAREMELTKDQKIRYFHHVLRDHALGFYRDFIEDKVQNWGEILRMMNDEFNSDVKMEYVADRLRNMHINQYEKEGRTEAEAFRAMAKDIQLLTSQAPRDCRSDRHRRRVLEDGIRGHQWALHVVANTDLPKMTYQRLLHQLETALQRYRSHLYIDTDNALGANSIYRKGRLSDTNFTGPARYGRNPKNSTQGWSKSPSQKPNLDFCWNCERPGCSVGKCAPPKDIDRIRKNRVKYFEARKGVSLDRRTKDKLLEFAFFTDSPSSESEPSDDEEDPASNEMDKMTEIHHSLLHNRSSHDSDKPSMDVTNLKKRISDVESKLPPDSD